MAEQLKYLYNEKFIEQLSQNIKPYYKDFKEKEFYNSIFDESWDSLELKQRMRHISTILFEYLPKDYTESINILKQTYPYMASTARPNRNQP